MAQVPSAWPDPAQRATNQGRQLRRWLMIGGLIAVLLLVAAAAVYAGNRLTDDPESSAAETPSAEPSSTEPPIPPFLESPTAPPPPNPGRVFCGEVNKILDDLVFTELDYVEAARDVADRLRQLDAPTPTHQAALDELIDEFEAAAQMVEDDPAAEEAAMDRDVAAGFAFIDAGGCDPT